MRRRLPVILVAAVLIGGYFAYLKFDRWAPNELYELVHGSAPVSVDFEQLAAEGKGLSRTYRDKWMARAEQDGALVPAGAKQVCALDDVETPVCDFRSLQAAFDTAVTGDVFILGPGIYEEAAVLRADLVTIRARKGAHVRGKAAEGKAALVIKGSDTTVEGLECSDIQVSARNGACIRLEGPGLTLRGAHFHDAQQGILVGKNMGRVLVEDSMFERLGAGGRAHGIYMNGGKGTELIVRRTHILGSKDQGHEIKSRAAITLIEDSVIASLDGQDSRLIDLPNGGLIVIRNNLLQQGPNTVNANLIGIGLELKETPTDPEAHRSLITGNIMVLDRHANQILHVERVPKPEFVMNAVIGGLPDEVPEGNFWIRDRETAGLGIAPILPQ